MKSYTVGMPWNCLVKKNLTSTHNIGFGREMMNLECHFSHLAAVLHAVFNFN